MRTPKSFYSLGLQESRSAATRLILMQIRDVVSDPVFPVICLIDGVERSWHYDHLKEAIDAEWVNGNLDCLTLPDQCDLCIVSDEFNSQSTVLMLEASRRGIPTLHIVDGIIEWRNCWENPRSQTEHHGMPLLMPVLADKIACIGRSQARILEAWGNRGKCEVIGVPRFDRLLGRTPRVRQDGPFRLLIMTAKTPGFTDEQIAIARRSLVDLKAWIESYNHSSHIPIRPIWRVTAGLSNDLCVPNELRDTTGADLATVLSDVDAVITTPSTAILESMLYDLPVAVLDYTNSPQFVAAAWSVSCREHLDQVVRELICPPQSKRLHQKSLLCDHLECHTPATPRLVTLIREMLRWSQHRSAVERSNRLPFRILPNDDGENSSREQTVDFSLLFPEHSVFAETDLVRLQAELGHVRLALKSKTEELAPFLRMLRRMEANPLTRSALWLRRQFVRRVWSGER
jgi:hypothetical protein